VTESKHPACLCRECR